MKNLFILSLFILSSFSARCTHLMGGEIVVQNDQVGNYEILLTLYRDITGVLMPGVQNLKVFDSAGNLVSTIASNLDSTAFHPVFGLPNISLLPNNFYGTEIYFYSAIFPCVNPGNYTVTWNNCCRNPSIVNMINPGALSMFLECSFNVDLLTSNSSPFFLSPPVVSLPVNTPWQYNPLPFDDDGDSLVWSLGTPYDYVPGSFPNGYPIIGYTIPPSLNGGNLSINSYSGEISWIASSVGNYVYTIICEEYRNGVKLGEIRRDMQFIVFPNGNLPSLSNLNNFSIDQNGIPYVESVANGSLLIDLFIMDSSSFFLSFDGIGETFDDSLNIMTSTITATNNPYEKKITLSWLPNSSNSRSEPYIINARFFNGTFSMDYTFFLYVNEDNTGLFKDNPIKLKSYPNPSSGLFTTQININKSQNVEYLVTNNFGEVVINKNINLTREKNQIYFNKKLTDGMYIVTIKLENGESLSSKILIKN